MTAVMTCQAQGLGDLNTEVVAHELRVMSAGAQLELLARDIPAAQQLREFIHNAVHAISMLDGVGDILITRVIRGGVGKLAVIDNGCGMSGRQLRDLIGQLSSSATSVDGSRFGVGSKITGLYRNPCGLEYTTHTGTDAPVTATLALDPADDSYRWLGGANAFQVPGQLPELIEKAGHGTQVVLLGASPEEDTFEAACGLPSGNKRLARYVNTRYDDLPAGISIAVAANRNKRTERLDHRSADVRGARVALEASSTHRGHVALPGATARWYYTDPSAPKQRVWDNNDNCKVRGIVAVSFADPEVHGLSELYEPFTGSAANSKFASFGLAQIASQMALVIEPDDVYPNSGRTRLSGPDGAPLPWDLWAAAFKEQMPDELTELIERALSSRRAGDDSRLLEKLFHNALLFSVKAYTAGRGSGSLRRAGGNGATGEGRESNGRGEPGAGRDRKASTGGGPGHGPGGTAAETGDGAEVGGNIPGLVLPTVVEVSGSDVPEDLIGLFASYAEDANQMFVNVDFPGIDQELAQHLARRKNLTAADRSAARRAVLDAMVDRVREAIVRAAALAPVSSGWSKGIDRDLMFSPYALTMTALTTQTGWTETSSGVSRSIGK